MQTRTIENGKVIWHFTAEEGDEYLEDWISNDEFCDTFVTEVKVYVPKVNIVDAYRALENHSNLLSATSLANESFGEDDDIRIDVSKVEFYANDKAGVWSAVYRAYEKFSGVEFNLTLDTQGLIDGLIGEPK